MGTVLLFHVNIFKSSQIINLCKEQNHVAILVPKSDYAKTLGALANISGMKSNASYKGEEFLDEMMVFSGMDSDTMDRFLLEYKKNNIAPIKRKAMLTPTNVMWSAEKLYKELEDHVAGK